MFGGPHKSFMLAEECVRNVDTKSAETLKTMSIYYMMASKHTVLSDIMLQYRNFVYTGMGEFQVTYSNSEEGISNSIIVQNTLSKPRKKSVTFSEDIQYIEPDWEGGWEPVRDDKCQTE